jgi:hypothetical protein
MHAIVPPLYLSRMFGWPEYLRLTDAEHHALALIHLGGIEALRSNGERTACKTVDSLVRKGLLESLEQCTLPDGSVRRGGLTDWGKYVAQSAADTEHDNIPNVMADDVR